jgi:hypothetical protein
MANVTPVKPDQEQETIIRRRIVSAEKAAPPPNFWEYVSKLKPEDWCTPGGTPLHTVYVYRDEPPPTLPLAKSTTAVFTETNIPWAEQEEQEMGFLNRFGGGRYRMILKKGSERICVGGMLVPGPYKNLTARVPESAAPPGIAPNPVYGNGLPTDPAARIAETAMSHLAGKEHEAVTIGVSALSHAANVLKSFDPSKPAPTDDLQRAFMNAMITRLTAPTPDPIETFARMAALLRESAPASNGGIAGSVMDRVISQIVDRGLNPPASGSSGGPVGMGIELVRILPNVAQYVTEAMGNYARITEAQRDALALQRGAQPGYVVQPPRPNPPPAIAAPAPTPGANGGVDAMTFIEQKIIEILREPQSAEWAAEEALNFLDRMDASIVPQLVSGGEQGLMSLFQSRPVLKPALDNLPRLQEFIRSFMKFAGESAKPEQKPN